MHVEPLRNSAVPPGLERFSPFFPALKRWATIGRPFGTEFCRDIPLLPAGSEFRNRLMWVAYLGKLGSREAWS